MRKFKMLVEELRVDSFHVTAAQPALRGTVRGHDVSEITCIPQNPPSQWPVQCYDSVDPLTGGGGNDSLVTICTCQTGPGCYTNEAEATV